MTEYMNAFVYVNSKGKEITRYSYSAGQDFRYCPQKFHLRRRIGWREKIRRATMLYGIAIENSVRFYHDNDLKGGVKRFEEEWAQHEKDESITYGAHDSWSIMRQQGVEHMTLYDILLPTFPIVRGRKPKLQVPMNKEMFPGTELAGIEIICYADMIATMRETLPIHGGNRKIGIDIKASAKRLNT